MQHQYLSFLKINIYLFNIFFLGNYRNFKTALHYAVDGSQNNAVKMLLEGKWSDVNSMDSKGWTPIMRAGTKSINLKIILFLRLLRIP